MRPPPTVHRPTGIIKPSMLVRNGISSSQLSQESSHLRQDLCVVERWPDSRLSELWPRGMHRCLLATFLGSPCEATIVYLKHTQWC